MKNVKNNKNSSYIEIIRFYYLKKNLKCKTKFYKQTKSILIFDE